MNHLSFSPVYSHVSATRPVSLSREWKWTATRKQVHCSVYFWSPVPSSSPDFLSSESPLAPVRLLLSFFTRLLPVLLSLFPASSPLLPSFSPFLSILSSVRSERANDSSPECLIEKSSHFTVSYWKKNFLFSSFTFTLLLFYSAWLQAGIQTNIKHHIMDWEDEDKHHEELHFSLLTRRVIWQPSESLKTTDR